ncbi:Severe Depolymerization of Actin [Savitreella phatthalungensis]
MRSRTALLPTNLLALQNLLKRDPQSYRDEFTGQLDHYRAQLEIFRGAPSSKGEKFGELVSFLAQVATCFREELEGFPAEVAELLERHHRKIDSELREKLVAALALLRNKGVLSSIELIKIFLPLLASSDSRTLRTQLYETIVSTCKSENAKGRNHSFNRAAQAMLFEMVQNEEAGGLWAVRLTRDMWEKHVWQGDARAVEICKDAALSLELKVMLSGIYFFLGVDNPDAEDSDDETPQVDLRKLQHQAGINKASKNRRQQVIRAMKADKRKRASSKDVNVNFPAIQLLHDPQGFAEKLYTALSKRHMQFEHKLLLLNLLSRLISTHKLTVLPLYSFLLKWISPHQRDVTKVLAALAGATHEFIPPEVVTPAIKKVANEFCTAGVNPEVVCAGLNTIREISTRQPLAMDETLLSDLIEYKTSKDKGVNMAARGLIGLFREIAPEMLPRKERGKSATMAVSEGAAKRVVFGEERGVVRGIENLDVLEEEEDEDAWDAFEVEEDDDDGEGWINVESDQEIDFSDSDDEGANAKPTKDNTDATQTELADSVAARRLLNPADLRKLAEARETAPDSSTHHARAKQQQLQQAIDKSAAGFVDAVDIVGPHVKRGKDDKAARLASVAEGREGREAFGSAKRRREEGGRSTTNREKARKKNFAMAKHARDIRLKQGRKLTEKRRELRAHLDRSKRGGRRGNR